MTTVSDTRHRAASEFYPPITLTTAKCRPWCVRHACDHGDVMHYSDWLTVATGTRRRDQLRICVEFIEAPDRGCRCGECDCGEDAGPYIVIEKLFPASRTRREDGSSSASLTTPPPASPTLEPSPCASWKPARWRRRNMPDSYATSGILLRLRPEAVDVLTMVPQRFTARQIGVSQVTIHRWMRHKNGPGTSLSVGRLIAMLNMEFEDIFDIIPRLR